MHLANLISDHARYRPTRTALVYGGRTLTYAELDQRVASVAAGLQSLGLAAGDRFATVLGNGIELVSLYWAAARTGMVVVPLSPLLGGRALAGLLLNSGCRAVILGAEQAAAVRACQPLVPGIAAEAWLATGEQAGDFASFDEMLQRFAGQRPVPVEPGPDDAFNIVYSSGTTGDPKGIVHSHRVRALYGALFANSWRMRPESVVLHSGSIVFNGAFVTLMPCFTLGASYVLLDSFDPERVIAAIEEHQVTHTMLVPSQIIALINHPHCTSERLSSLEMLLSLGAPLLREHKQQLDRLLPGRFHELYGLTEGFITILDKQDHARKPDSVGIPMIGSEMRIVDPRGEALPAGEVGEIAGRGPLLMSGYHDRPDLTAEAIRDGWLFSGDLGYVDEDGFLYLVDRKKDLIISGGVNVYPRDIEEVVATHPEVRETAVFGVADSRWGETPVAAVVLRTGSQADADALRDWVNQSVQARYQRVSRVIILDAFPRNVAGKVLKRELRARLESGGH